MEKHILFTLENCIKCTQTKEVLNKKNINYDIIKLPHEIGNWKENHHEITKKYNVFNDIQRTAPILIADGEKIIGYLRIRKYFQQI